MKRLTFALALLCTTLSACEPEYGPEEQRVRDLLSTDCSVAEMERVGDLTDLPQSAKDTFHETCGYLVLEAVQMGIEQDEISELMGAEEAQEE